MATEVEEPVNYSRRSRRGGDMDDDDEAPRSRRGRRVDDDEEEEDTSRSRRGRRGGDEEEEEDSGRRSRRGRGRDEDEEDSRSAPKKAGGTLSSMPESRRIGELHLKPVRRAISLTTIHLSSSEDQLDSSTDGANSSYSNGYFSGNDEKIQQAVLDGMFKFAEQKYGRKRSAPAQKKRNVMDDYDIYLRSLKAKCKTSDDRVATVLKQKREVDEKYKKAEADAEKQRKILQDAEDEKQAAIDEGRDPKLPEGFVAPAAATKKGGFANLVMKASAQLWEDKFNAMRAKKGSDDQPAWMKEKAGGRRSEKVLLNVGKARQKKTDKHEEPKWASKGGLKKAERGGRGGDHDDRGTAFAVQLRKTKKDEKEEPEKKVDWRSRVKKGKKDEEKEEQKEEEPKEEAKEEEENEEPSEGRRSRRRRGGDDSD